MINKYKNKENLYDFQSIPVGYKFVDSQRSIGYTTRTAIADLTDNSEDANATKISIYLESPSVEAEEIFIADNGTGMSEEVLYGSYKLGYDRPRVGTEQGKFGVGGTLSCLSIASEKTTITRDKNGIYARSYDLDQIKEYDKWGSSVVEVTEDMIKQFDHYVGAKTGTLIILSNLDKLSNKNISKIKNDLKNHLSGVYCEKIGPEFSIEVNGDIVEAWDPLCWYDKNVERLVDEKIEGTNIRIRVADVSGVTVKARKSLTKHDGGYVFRCQRLIESRIVNDDVWTSLWSRAARYRDCRWAVFFDAEDDDIMGTTSQKNTVNPRQAIHDKIGNIVMPYAKQLADRREKRDVKVTEQQAQKDLDFLSSVANKVADKKTVTFEASSGNKNKSNIINIKEKIIQESDLNIPKFVLKEASLGKAGEVVIIRPNDDQSESHSLICMNTDHPYMVNHWSKGSKEVRDCVSTWLISFALTLQAQPDNDDCSMEDLRSGMSNMLRQITRDLDKQ